jgi:hypothetical protein
LEFLRIQIPERNKIHQDPWDIPSQPLIRTFFLVNSSIRTWYQRVPRPIPKDWKARIRSRASTFDFSSLRLIRATRTTRSRPGRAAIWKAGSPRKSI